MKTYKTPRGFVRFANDTHLEDGTIVYLEPMYVGENESPRRIVVMETPSGGIYLLANDKRMYNRGEGYLYGSSSIAYYKPQI